MQGLEQGACQLRWGVGKACRAWAALENGAQGRVEIGALGEGAPRFGAFMMGPRAFVGVTVLPLPFVTATACRHREQRKTDHAHTVGAGLARDEAGTGDALLALGMLSSRAGSLPQRKMKIPPALQFNCGACPRERPNSF